MTNVRSRKVVERRVLIIRLGISVLEAIPLVESVAGVHITGFWPLPEIRQCQRRLRGGCSRWE